MATCHRRIAHCGVTAVHMLGDEFQCEEKTWRSDLFYSAMNDLSLCVSAHLGA